MIAITQGTYFVSLPEVPGFSVNPQRMTAARTAMAGNKIRQESALHASSAEPVYSGDIDPAPAAILQSMYLVSSSVVLWYKNKIYATTFHPVFNPGPGKKLATTIRFGVVREVVQ